jgi:hypothetical protein
VLSPALFVERAEDLFKFFVEKIRGQKNPGSGLAMMRYQSYATLLELTPVTASSLPDFCIACALEVKQGNLGGAGKGVLQKGNDASRQVFVEQQFHHTARV